MGTENNKLKHKRDQENERDREELNKRKRNDESLSNDKNNEELNSEKRRRGPKTGFINKKINSKLKEIIKQLNLDLEVKDGEIVIDKQNNDISKNSLNSDVSNVYNKIKSSDSMENVINQLSILYNSNENGKNILKNCNKIVTLYNKKNQNNATKTKDININNTNNSLKIIHRYPFNFIQIDYKLILEFFNLPFYCIYCVIRPTELFNRIRKKILSPGLLCAIYSAVYKDGSNKNIELSDYYYDLAKKYVYNNIHIADIQNIQTASLLSDLSPGTRESYLLFGISVRLIKALNIYGDDKKSDNFITFEERISIIWHCVNGDVLLSITSNRLDQANLIDQPLVHNLDDLFFINKYPPEDFALKYIVILKFMIKVIKHASNRRKGNFNIIEFRKLIENLEYIGIRLKKEYFLVEKDKEKSKNKFLMVHYYSYLLFYATKLILFNIELSPYVFKKKLSPTNKYVQIDKEKVFSSSSFENITSNSKNKIFFFNNDIYDEDFEVKYKANSIMGNVPSKCFIYKLFDDSQKYENDDIKFLKIPPIINGFDYETCYHICCETVENSKIFLNKINKKFSNSQRCYPSYLCWVFYNIGLFFMLIYANVKTDQEVKDNIEYFHEQVNAMYIYYPYLSYHFSKLYEKAKIQAYEAASNDSLIFCPQGDY